MCSADKRPRPETCAKDVAHTLVKASLSAIPVAGGPAAELFVAVFRPPFEQRRDEWVQSVAEGLEALEDAFEGFVLDNLHSNESFVTTAMHASQCAIRNHQRDKLDALRGAVLNSALPGAPDDDLQLMFLDAVDSLTSTHIALLRDLDTIFELYRLGPMPGESTEKWPHLDRFHQRAPEWALHHAFYTQASKDLEARGFIDRALDTQRLRQRTRPVFDHDPRTYGPENFLPPVTPMGERFLSFIKSPIDIDKDGPGDESDP